MAAWNSIRNTNPAVYVEDGGCAVREKNKSRDIEKSWRR